MPGNLNLQKDKYEFLKRSAQERAEAMENYASETDLCRSRYLLRYFGQEKSADCGCCDICRARTGRARTEEAIRNFAEAHPGFTLREFKAWCDDPANAVPSDAMEVYRGMIDEAKILSLHSDES